jgi:protein-tyrosine phosphatase
MAEVLLRRRLEQAGVSATVSSAGLHPGGRPATAHGVETMAERGLDLAPHRSRQLAAGLVQQADLVIGMAREHVREAAVVEPGAIDRSFTLKELVRLAESAGPRRAGEPLDGWLGRLVAGRRREDLLGVGHDDAFDIEDPVGRGRADYDATADEIDRLLARLVDLAWPATIRQGQERSA